MNDLCNAERLSSTSATSDCAARHRPNPLGLHRPIRHNLQLQNLRQEAKAAFRAFARATRKNSQSLTNKCLKPLKSPTPFQNFTEDCSKAKNTIKRLDDKLSNHLSENTTLDRRLFQVENSFSIKADEVHLIRTSFVPWLVWCLRIGEALFFDLAEHARGWVIDPQTLSQLTNR